MADGVQKAKGKKSVGRHGGRGLSPPKAVGFSFPPESLSIAMSGGFGVMETSGGNNRKKGRAPPTPLLIGATGSLVNPFSGSRI